MRILNALCILFLFICLPLSGDSKEPKQYFVRTGYFNWSEYSKDNRVTFEHGPVVGYGYDRVLHREEKLVVTGTFELWGGLMNRFEHDTSTGMSGNCVTGYLGTREEANADVHLIEGSRLTFGPRFGLAHKMWVRSSNREWWNVFTVKAGTATNYRFPSGYTLYWNCGIAATALSYDFMDNYSIGYSSVWMRPGNRYSMFAEYGLETPKRRRVSVSYEPMEFGPSVPKNVPRNHATGSRIFMLPESKSSSYWLKVGIPF